MIEEVIPIFGIIFGIGLPAAVVITWITLNYRKRRRLMELHHAERMAAIERGMDIPQLPMELIDGKSERRPRTALLPGLIWFFVGLAFIISTLSMHDDDVPLLAGLIPLGIGLAYLIYYFVEGRQLENKLPQEQQRPRIEGG